MYREREIRCITIIDIYIERERERYTHITSIYIYIYRERERVRAKYFVWGGSNLLTAPGIAETPSMHNEGEIHGILGGLQKSFMPVAHFRQESGQPTHLLSGQKRIEASVWPRAT